MATASGISRAWISRGFHRPKKCVWLLAEIALRENENIVAATAKLTRGRRDRNISSAFSGDVEETKGIGGKEKG